MELSIEEMKNALLVCTLMNVLYSKEDKLTYLMLGPTASGKSSVVREICESQDWDYDIIDCNTLGEKEIAGWPYKDTDKYGSPCLSFYPYETIAKIMNIEKEYESKFDLYKASKSDPSFRLELMSKGLKIHYIFIDELNRANRSVMQEIMNIVLKRKIRDYTLPWWVEIVTAGNSISLNSAYSVTHLDRAQLRRFVLAKSKIDKSSWVNYMLENNNINDNSLDYINYIKGCDDKYFAEVNEEDLEKTEQIPTQYGHTQCCNIYSNKDDLMKKCSNSYFKGWSNELYFNTLKSIYIGIIGESAVEDNKRLSVINFKDIYAKVMTLNKEYLENLSAIEGVIVKDIVIENLSILKDTNIMELLPAFIVESINATINDKS